MTAPPFAETVTIVNRTKSGTDSFGNDVWAETSTPWPGVFNPGTSAELVQGEDLLTVQPAVYLYGSPTVGPYDRVEVAGLSYEVDGNPNAWSSPFTGWSPGVQVNLRRVTG